MTSMASPHLTPPPLGERHQDYDTLLPQLIPLFSDQQSAIFPALVILALKLEGLLSGPTLPQSQIHLIQTIGQSLIDTPHHAKQARHILEKALQNQ